MAGTPSNVSSLKQPNRATTQADFIKPTQTLAALAKICHFQLKLTTLQPEWCWASPVNNNILPLLIHGAIPKVPIGNS